MWKMRLTMWKKEEEILQMQCSIYTPVFQTHVVNWLFLTEKQLF